MTRPWRIEGHWYPAGESRRVDARLEPGPLGRVRLFRGTDEAVEYELHTLSVSPRLGHTPRSITFPDGAVLETADNDAVDRMLATRGRPRGGLVHWLESHRAAILVAVFLTVAFVWGSIQFGVPMVARHIAHSLPADTLDQVSGETLAMLDRARLEPTTLDESRRAQLQRLFQPVLDEHGGQDYRVLFREGGEAVGANALALPDGTLVFTDELVRLARDEEELLAILAHELGHVEHRHSLRALIESSLLGLGMAALFGDASGMAELLAGMPVVFASLSYSRAHELEADRFSARWLDRNNISRQAFVSIMRRLQAWTECRSRLDDAGEVLASGDKDWRERCEASSETSSDSSDSSLSRYLSTHPAIEERLRRF